ncbi:DUF7426 family protein [Promicromonospora iranensis]|uniref:DUF7426 domain-containing protein n=1 Tax=Promicromonospora iranensis TaxID=1105144 RepID=A0ABU2CV48_9MICO|nr:hypothetical protein [Promicromonospora iranensis]MDR7385207.1 hypothetical protein [Promicromonospora iranensis]
MELSGLTEFLGAVEAKDSITLPWRGEKYVIPAPGPARRLRCAGLLAALGRPDGAEREAAVADAIGDEAQDVLIFGEDVAARMEADDVPIPVRSHLATVALVAWVQGEAAAQRYIDAAAAGEKGPKAKAPSKAPRTGTRSDAASTTKRPASTSGTRPRRSASPKPAAKAPDAPSTGGTSSPAGPSS